MKLKRNRYQKVDLLDQLRKQEPQKDGNEWCFKFECHKYNSEIDDFEAYLPNSIHEHEKYRHLLSDFLNHIDYLDNLVQDSCETDYEKSELDIKNYMLHIGYIDLKEGQVSICYYGTAVNTEWEAEFQKNKYGEWIKVNF